MQKMIPMWPSDEELIDEKMSQSDVDGMLLFFHELDVKMNMTIVVTKVYIENIGTVEDYECRVVGKFYQNGDLHISTADGNFINVQEMVNHLERFTVESQQN